MKGSLREIIERVESLEWDHLLFAPGDELSLITPVAVIEDDGITEVYEGMRYFLGVQDVQSIVKNLQQQILKPDPEQILKAIKYYHENDAFINVQG